ncbi:hypothetical protein [Nocardia neocaledoniensis]|uniref:hypothetical protein n=1 Tax=Nocardia neocaledoniensis TaxID=236511 RepID=UPI002455F4C7|nr:hypothetical protein [Nocardia neocaledoniensis]
MTTNPAARKRNPVVTTAAAKIRKRSDPAPLELVPTPDQLPLFPVEDLTRKANR